MCKECGCGEQTKVVTLHVPGMMCENCENTVKKALLKEVGVLSVEVDLKDKTVTVHVKDSETSIVTLEQAVEATGFDVIKEKTKVVEHTHSHGILNAIGRWFK